MAPRGTEADSAPFLIAVGGLVASGKSHVARALAERSGATHLEADRIRDELVEGEGDSLRSLDPLVSAEGYAALHRRAEAELAAGRSVVVDACFPLVTQREGMRSLARRHGALFRFVECRVDAGTRSERLAARDARAGEPGWVELAEALERSWEPVEGIVGADRLVLDTSGSLEDALVELETRLEERTPIPGGTPVRAVTFDCWNTLLVEADWKVAHAQRVSALARAAAEAGRPVDHDEAGRAFDAAWERHMRLWSEGVVSGAPEVARWALAELGLRDPLPALEHLTRLFQEASHSGRVVALPGAVDTLEALARAGVHRALVCDTGLTPGRIVRLHLERLGLLRLLEVQVFSDEVGVPKPDARAFRAALEPLGIAPHAALHVGDLLRTDVAGARGLGMATARIHASHDDRSDLPEADYVVASHVELQALLASRVERIANP